MWLFRELALWWWVYWPSSFSGLLFFLSLPRSFYACRGNGRIFHSCWELSPAGPYDSFLLFSPSLSLTPFFSPALQQSLSSGSSCVAQRKLNHKAWLMKRIEKESWGLLRALQRGGQAPEAPGSNSRRPPQRSGFLRPTPRAFGSQAMWLEFPPLFFFLCLNFPVSFGKPGLWSSVFFSLSTSFSIYIFPLCLVFPCVFLMASRVASTKRVWRICYTWPLHTTTAGSSSCQQHSPMKKCQLDQQNPESSIKTTASQIRALLWHAFLRSTFVSRPCNCGLYDWLMQTWQVQDTVLKPKYWLLMLLGMQLEYKTAHCTLKMPK